MEDRLNLKRFLDAQSTSYEQALTEIKNGRKKSCWMWYIFPQYKGIGRSITSMEYAIQSQEEANVYINHPILGVRLLEITEAFLSLENKTAYFCCRKIRIARSGPIALRGVIASASPARTI